GVGGRAEREGEGLGGVGRAGVEHVAVNHRRGLAGGNDQRAGRDAVVIRVGHGRAAAREGDGRVRAGNGGRGGGGGEGASRRVDGLGGNGKVHIRLGIALRDRAGGGAGGDRHRRVEQHRDVAAQQIRHGQVGPAVAVDVGQGQANGSRAGGEGL